MATYKSDPVTLNGPQTEVFDKISNIGAYQEILDSMPEDIRAKAGDVKFSEDAITINAAPVGEMRFDVTDRRAPETVEFTASGAPVKMTLHLDLEPGSDPSTTSLVSRIEVDVPAILKPMIGPKMKEAATQMSALVARIFNASRQ